MIRTGMFAGVALAALSALPASAQILGGSGGGQLQVPGVGIGGQGSATVDPRGTIDTAKDTTRSTTDAAKQKAAEAAAAAKAAKPDVKASGSASASGGVSASKDGATASASTSASGSASVEPH